MTAVADSFDLCRRVARSRARNFYYSFALLPREQRDALCAVYAFMRRADDISDDLSASIEQRRAALNAWRAALTRALAGDAGDDPILPAFAATAKRYEIPSEYFFDLIRGVESDLEPQRYETFDQLYLYCYRVASVVGMTLVHVFGFDDRRALGLAEKCGVGFQLTNILRDIPEDAAMGRVYLPEQDLRRFGLSSEMLLENRGGRRPEHPGFARMMAFEWERAQGCYREAAPLLGMVRAGSRPALWAMIAIYHGILRRIRRVEYDVYRRRPRLSAAEKSWIVLRAAWASRLGGSPPFPA